MTQLNWSDPPSQTAFPVAKAGYPFIFASAFATAVFALLGVGFLAILGLLVTGFICFFFRDPDRLVPGEAGAIVSPADGKVIKVEPVAQTPYFEGACIRVSVFMSIFNVHVNRAPHEGTIRQVSYHPGKFFSANLDKASADNEHNALLLESPDGKPVGVVQIAGLVARRIICRVQAGDSIGRGQRFGLICFGSRLDVYLPVDTEILVAVGEKVQAGTTILGKW
ncbi:phosphatidylserine decarboxylase proenzyme [Desulfosarcina ovata subsp. sediminis]|uniref:Phosphatidylserine decarboxylase proenzyme n=1 Tax=Desulfosarcina ovata subsp. sediminis TaxID=885957 RepID=A0A5K7ZF55_9BACT|nr:phosphatidylserine decarboxylase family protein [Desulfosarcina ovata]BBO79586.1 phosphatidylserine decarboxylase proenzyme [Desulfosarcina ovata subsp. sediminis]